MKKYMRRDPVVGKPKKRPPPQEFTIVFDSPVSAGMFWRAWEKETGTPPPLTPRGNLDPNTIYMDTNAVRAVRLAEEINAWRIKPRIRFVGYRARTSAQIERQDYREHSGAGRGQYSKFNACELCGKSVGYDYFSHSAGGGGPFEGRGIVLHEKCADRLEVMPEEDAAEMLHTAAEVRARGETFTLPKRR